MDVSFRDDFRCALDDDVITSSVFVIGVHMFRSWLESCEDCVVFGRSVLLLGGRLVLSWVWGPFGVPVSLIVVAVAGGVVESGDVIVAPLIESLDELTVALCTSLDLEAPLVSSVYMESLVVGELTFALFLSNS